MRIFFQFQSEFSVQSVNNIFFSQITIRKLFTGGGAEGCGGGTEGVQREHRGAQRGAEGHGGDTEGCEGGTEGASRGHGGVQKGHRGARRETEGCRGAWRVCREAWRGDRGMQRGTEGRGHRGVVEGCMEECMDGWLLLATIDLVGDNREFKV